MLIAPQFHALEASFFTFRWKKGVNFVEKKKVCIFALRNAGLMAEWLGTALQKLLQRFESASDLTKTALEAVLTLFFFCFVIHL